MKKLATIAVVLLVLLAGCCSAQLAASADAEWDGACLQRYIFTECFKGDGPKERVCVPDQPAFTLERAQMRVKLAGERLERLGKTCDGWKP
jgi:hypothetical protein